MGRMHESAGLDQLATDLRQRLPAVLAEPANPTVADLCRRFVADVIRRLTAGEGDEQCRAEDAARELVDAGIAEEDAIPVFRGCVRAVWDLARDLAGAGDPGTYHALLEHLGDSWLDYEHWTSAVGEAYRAAARSRDRRAAQEREAQVTALLTGAGGNQVKLRHSADALGLPKSGRFCVVVIERELADGGALADPEPVLRAGGVRSVWSLGPLEQAGIVNLGSADRFARVLDALRRATACRVGVSSIYDQLGHTPLAARLAHVALASVPPGTHAVGSYGDRPLETLVASAPETARDMGHTVLGGLLALAAKDRQVLLDTLDTWCDAGGNINRTAELLYCHRNTVRQRLDRIETLTGRSLSDPRGITETLIAVQAHRLHGLSG
jgi:PucR-like helix-turn-helix protein/diguanylate cyclase with GGDEF domain